MVLYGLSLLPLYEVMWEEDPGIIHPWYADDVAMIVIVGRSDRLLRVLMEKRPILWVIYGYGEELACMQGGRGGDKWRIHVKGP